MEDSSTPENKNDMNSNVYREMSVQVKHVKFAQDVKDEGQAADERTVSRPDAATNSVSDSNSEGQFRSRFIAGTFNDNLLRKIKTTQDADSTSCSRIPRDNEAATHEAKNVRVNLYNAEAIDAHLAESQLPPANNKAKKRTRHYSTSSQLDLTTENCGPRKTIYRNCFQCFNFLKSLVRCRNLKSELTETARFINRGQNVKLAATNLELTVGDDANLDISSFDAMQMEQTKTQQPEEEENRIMCDVTLNDHKVKMEWSTSSEHSTISEELWWKLGRPKIFGQFSKLKLYNAHVLSIVGTCELSVQFQQETRTLPALVLRLPNVVPRFGKEWIRVFNARVNRDTSYTPESNESTSAASNVNDSQLKEASKTRIPRFMPCAIRPKAEEEDCEIRPSQDEPDPSESNI